MSSVSVSFNLPSTSFDMAAKVKFHEEQKVYEAYGYINHCEKYFPISVSLSPIKEGER